MLIDTSTLLRTLQRRHPQHDVAVRALEMLPGRGRKLHIAPQNLVELWVVATRPVDQNGLGMSVTAAAGAVARIKDMVPILAETPALYPTWESLVTKYRVSGKPAPDAQLVPAMEVHGLTATLTFDKTGFSRYPDIEVLHPGDVAGSS